MYRNILVPLDQSELAESALPFAVSLAKRSGGEIHLVRVVSPLSLFSHFEEEEVDLKDAGSTWLEGARARAADYLEGTRSGVSESGDHVTINAHVLTGRPVPALTEWIRENGVDQVVMTTHGAGGFQRMWLGSVAEGLARSSPVPVFLWRSGDSVSEPEASQDLRGVLVPLDGSEAAEDILPWAEELARLLNTSLQLLTVVPAHGPLGSPATGRPDLEGAKRSLERVASQIRERGIPVEVEAVSAPAPHGGILSRLERGAMDIVALSTRGAGRSVKSTLGSVSDKVIRATPAHVLVHLGSEGP